MRSAGVPAQVKLAGGTWPRGTAVYGALRTVVWDPWLAL
jgi:hypothetical protein